MKKTLIIGAILTIVAVIGFVLLNKHNSSEPQQEIVSASAEANTEMYFSASVKLMPTIGTNISKPGQFEVKQ